MQRASRLFSNVKIGQKEDRIFVPMFGQYNIANALSAYAMSKELGFKLDIKKAFAEDPPNMVTLAIMSDSDNTRETSDAYIDFIEVSSE